MLDDTYGLKFFKYYLKSVDNILEIGANQGLFILFARNIFPKAQIHSYEPNSSLFSSLEHHSSFAGSTFFIEAVGLVSGRIKLQNETDDSLMTKTVLDDDGTIPQVSIKECINRIGGKVDLLKLDCEGAEWEILKDIDSLKKVRAITLEYHLDGTHDHKSILKVLNDADFKILHYSMTGPTWGMVWAVNNSYNK
jgi:FkbM family methyltransferase